MFNRVHVAEAEQGFPQKQKVILTEGIAERSMRGEVKSATRKAKIYIELEANSA